MTPPPVRLRPPPVVSLQRAGAQRGRQRWMNKSGVNKLRNARRQEAGAAEEGGGGAGGGLGGWAQSPSSARPRLPPPGWWAEKRSCGSSILPPLPRRGSGGRRNPAVVSPLLWNSTRVGALVSHSALSKRGEQW